MTSFAVLDRVRILLVETSHPGNIGAVARAMKNMGLRHLDLVRPRAFPDPAATSRASGATDILDQARVLDSVDDALADSTLVIGTSARSRNLPWPMLDPREAVAKVLDWAAEAPVTLMFGCETSGLTNSQLQRCHYHLQVPADPAYSSLNLAMAVQVVAYELRMGVLSQRPGENPPLRSPQDPGWDNPPASQAELEGLFAHLERTLTTLEFHDPSRPRQLMARLRRLFLRAEPDRMEVNILRGILKEVERACEDPVNPSRQLPQEEH